MVREERIPAGPWSVHIIFDEMAANKIRKTNEYNSSHYPPNCLLSENLESNNQHKQVERDVEHWLPDKKCHIIQQGMCKIAVHQEQQLSIKAQKPLGHQGEQGIDEQHSAKIGA